MSVLDLSLATPPAPIGRCGHTHRRRRLDGGVRGHGIYLPLPTCAAHRHYVAGLGDEPALCSPLSEQIRFLGNGFLGAVVAMNQNFTGLMKISEGGFTFADPLYIDPFLLSTGSLFTISGQFGSFKQQSENQSALNSPTRDKLETDCVKGTPA